MEMNSNPHKQGKNDQRQNKSGKNYFLPTSIIFALPVTWTPAPPSCVQMQMMSLRTKIKVRYLVRMLERCSASRERIIRPSAMYTVSDISGDAVRMSISCRTHGFITLLLVRHSILT